MNQPSRATVQRERTNGRVPGSQQNTTPTRTRSRPTSSHANSLVINQPNTNNIHPNNFNEKPAGVSDESELPEQSEFENSEEEEKFREMLLELKHEEGIASFFLKKTKRLSTYDVEVEAEQEQRSNQIEDLKAILLQQQKIKLQQAEEENLKIFRYASFLIP